MRMFDIGVMTNDELATGPTPFKKRNEPPGSSGEGDHMNLRNKENRRRLHKVSVNPRNRLFDLFVCSQ